LGIFCYIKRSKWRPDSSYSSRVPTSDTIQHCTTTGTDEVNKSDVAVNVYPNPVNSSDGIVTEEYKNTKDTIKKTVNLIIR